MENDLAAASSAGFRLVQLHGEGGDASASVEPGQAPAFAQLVEDTPTLEDVCPGRRGCSLYHAAPDAPHVPLARSTTSYKNPLAPMRGAVRAVAEGLARAHGQAPAFYNTALAEVYDARYATMGYHSDQAQDLEPGTHIAVYSCYASAPADPARPPRVLLVKPKAAPPGTVPWRVPLPHHAAVCFDLAANRTHVHSIRLNREAPDHADNDWYGLTLRRSRSAVTRASPPALVEVVQGEAVSTPLHLAADAERRALMAARRSENRECVDGTGGVYPAPCGATLSAGDLMPPL